jgi:RimJ/RimL family protein N-acetyltransferase
VEQLVHLFDTEEMNRWTPLPHPFTTEVAVGYVRSAQSGMGGVVQRAICLTADGPAVGEVLVFPAPERGAVELAYAVGAEHRGQGIGARAVRAALALPALAGQARAVLTIAEDNVASQATARAAGFSKTDAPLRRRERKGFVLMMETWARELDPPRR